MFLIATLYRVAKLKHCFDNVIDLKKKCGANMKKTIKIFNPMQIDVFLKQNAKAIGCGIGRYSKLYIEFVYDEHFEQLLQKWSNHEFEIK